MYTLLLFMHHLQGSPKEYTYTSNCPKSHWELAVRKITVYGNGNNNIVAPRSLSNYWHPILKVLYEYI